MASSDEDLLFLRRFHSVKLFYLLILQGQFYNQAKLLQEFDVTFDQIPEPRRMPVVEDPVTGDRLIFALHFFSAHRRVTLT